MGKQEKFTAEVHETLAKIANRVDSEFRPVMLTYSDMVAEIIRAARIAPFDTASMANKTDTTMFYKALESLLSANVVKSELIEEGNVIKKVISLV